MLRAVVTAVALGIIVGQATLDYVFPEVAVTDGYDANTWKRCDGRKPVKVGTRKAWWYCGPSPETANGSGTDGRAVSVAQGAAPGSASTRSAGGRGKAKGGR